MDTVASLTLGQTIAGLGVVGAFVTGVVVFVRRARAVFVENVVPFWRQVTKALIVLNGREPIRRPEDGVEVAPAIPGALDRLTRLDETTDRLMVQQAAVQIAVREIRAEVTHNGGGSLKDAVRRIEQRLEALGEAS